MTDNTVIQVHNLGKRFKIYKNSRFRALEWISLGCKNYHQDFWALKNISFELKRGECLGIIGPNGAGKTTLLRILTRALYPTTGSFQVQGNILSLMELGTGFNPELTGCQNIYRCSQLFGFPEKYVSERLQDIQEFADLGDFFHRPIKTYSSGMYIRLAFSMFVFLKPEVLVVDEALSVGDIFFQQKCFAKMREMLSSGITCLFASHDTVAVQNLCNRAILLNNGEIEYEGSPELAVSRYFRKLGQRSSSLKPVSVDKGPKVPQKKNFMPPPDILKHNIIPPNRHQKSSGGVEILAARIIDQHGVDTFQVPMMESLWFYILIRASEYVAEPNVGIAFFDRLCNLVFSTGTTQQGKRLPAMQKGEEFCITLKVTFTIQPGEYTFSLLAGEPSNNPNPNVGFFHHWVEQLGPLTVIYDSLKLYPFYGIASLPIDIDIHLCS